MTCVYADEVGAGGRVARGRGEVGGCWREAAASPGGGAEGEEGEELPRLPQHWYDEPPYESDPEDFLIAADLNR